MLTARRELKRRTDALGRIAFLGGCTTKELARIDRLGTGIDVPVGRTLIHEGANGSECFVVFDGFAIASREESFLGVIGPGLIAGEMALLYDAPRAATVVARSPMRLLVLDGDEFDALLDVAPCIRRSVDRIAAERTLQTARERRRRSDGLAPLPWKVSG